MGIVRVLADVEDWLESDAESWSALTDQEYVALVRRWRDGFTPLIVGSAASFRGDRAMQAIANQLSADVWLLSGVQVPELQNTGGLGAAGYRAAGLRRVRRDLANRLELLAVAADLFWSCVFSHEAGYFVREEFYERTPENERIHG